MGGFSGGATFASVVAYLARDERLDPPITGIFLSCPAFTDEVDDGTGKMVPVRALARTPVINANAPMLNQEMCERVAGKSTIGGRCRD